MEGPIGKMIEFRNVESIYMNIYIHVFMYMYMYIHIT